MIQQIGDNLLINTAIVVFILKVLWDMIVNKYKKNNETITALTQAMNDLRLAVTELKVEIKWLREATSEIPGIKSDLNHLGKKVRDMQADS